MLSVHLLITTILLVLVGAHAAGAGDEPAAADNADPAAHNDEARERDRPLHRYQLTSDSELRLSGRATIGSWRSTSDRVDGKLKPGVELTDVHALIERITEALAQRDAGNDDDDGAEAKAIDLALATHGEPRVELTVPVASLRSGKPGMERDMRDALRAEAHPRVTYALQRVGEAGWRVDEDNQRLVFELIAEGELSLAGVERTIEMSVRIEPMSPNRFRVLGRRTFDMADFDIEPPTALFGLIKADPSVEVVFDLVVEAVARSETDESADDQ